MTSQDEAAITQRVYDDVRQPRPCSPLKNGCHTGALQRRRTGNRDDEL